MTPDLGRWPGSDDLLDAALALPAEERVAYVRRTAADPEQVAALEAVLAEAAGDDEFLQPAGAWSGALGEEAHRAIEERPPTLAPGTAVEHYQVVGAIGRGGMGEVYRARDTKLSRDVALKVLPAQYARNSERQKRFHREARLLAALNHPGIGSIYGVAEADGVEALVLEFVEGPTLAEVLKDGPLELDEVLAIARQLADALAVAHGRGILHRDLKPANIKVTPPATVKILDFGLARVLTSAQDGDATDLTDVGAGALMGTAAYMSPEQARGRQVDQRTDIWAFGCVLFEMLTGARAFAGKSLTEVLTGIIERDPPFSLLPPKTPQPVRRLLRRCLEKEPERRLGYISDARLDLDDVADEPLESPAPSPAFPWLLVTSGVLLAAIAGVAGGWFARSAFTTPLRVSRLVVSVPAGDGPATSFQPAAALSPDGRTLVYRASRAGATQLFMRDMAQLGSTPIPGTENSTGPFFSPNGRWLGFDADGILKRVSLDGGTPVVICNAPGGVTAAWLPDDTIVFATNTTRVLQRVSASGGTPESLSVLDTVQGDTLHLLPQALPDGRTILFTVVRGATRHLAVLDLSSRRVRIVGEGTTARHLGDRYVVFAREGTLWGARVDPAWQALSGTAFPFDDRIAHTDNTVFHYAISGEGSLAYLPPQTDVNRQRLAWIDRRGVETPVDIEPRPYRRIALSPDASRIALAVEEDGNTDVWIAEPGRGTMSRLTFNATIDTMPTWSPDGRFVAFRSERDRPGVFRREARGTGTAERLTATDGPIHSPYSWTPDGKTLLLAVFRSFRQQAIGSVTPPETTVRVLLEGDFAQLDPHVSPDGRWMAYQSDETGRFEIYVRPYPDVDGGRWLVSRAGGTTPRWSADGRELFYHDGAALVRVPVERGATFEIGQPTRLFTVKPFGGRLGPDFEVAPDGQRFLFLLPGPPALPRSTGFVLVQNILEELRGRLSTR